MPYDALGNYVPGDDTPTSDDMSYATSVPTTQSYQQQRMARVPQNLQGMGAPARGLTDLLTGAARGTLAGTIGAPGDISQMLRDMSPEVRAVMERKFGSRSFPTTQETLPYIPSTNLSGTNVGETGATLGSNIVAPLAGPQLLGAAARGTAKAAKAAAPSVAQMAAELMEKQGLGPMYVVKPNKGGNWLKDEVERAVLPIKQYGILPHELATHPSNIIAEAVNSWVDKKLVPYIKNEMGTPEDPVRLGIEKRVADAKARKAQGKKRIAKLQAAVAEGERLGVPSQLTRDRLATEIDNVANQYDTDMASVMHSNDLKYNGRVPPRNQMSTTAQSKRWEGASDLQIGESTAGKLIEEKPFIVTGAFNARYKTQEEAQAYLDRLHKLGEFEPGIAERLRLIPPKIEETGAHIKNPWLKKVAPETPVYGVSAGIGDDLQFKHLTDELKNALNPQSGLPPELLLSPNKMPKTVDDAIAHVGEINAWRARNMANAQIKITEGMPVHKQYPEGYKWLELTKPKLPDVLPEGYTVKPTEKEGWFSVHEPPSKNYPNGRSTGAVGRSPEEAIANHDFNRDALDKALKYEGETMGHCVGSYCKDVESGKSRIYSLRDAKGEPHATIEVKPHNLPNKFSDLWDIAMKHVAEDSPGWDKLNEYGDPYEVLKEHFGSHSDDPKSTLEGILENFPEAKDAAMAEIENAHPVIAQIKGKQNRAPADKYLPFVQDFVKSQPWSEVGDLNNTGLTRYKDKYFTEPELKDFTKSVVDPTKEWYYNSPYHQTYKQDFDRKSDLYNDLNQWSERTNIPVGQQRFSISDIHGVLADPGAYELSVLEDVRDAVDWLKVNQPEIPKHLLPETPPTESMTPLQAPTGNALDPRGDLATAIRLGGGTPPTYATQDEIEALVRRYVPDEGMKDGGVVRMKDGGVVRMQEGGRAIPNGFELNQYMPSAPANAQPIATEPTPQATIAQMRAELQRAKEGTQALSAQFPSVKPAFPDLGKAYGATEAAGNMLYNTAIAVPGAFGAVGKSVNDYAAGRTPYPATSLDTHMGDFMQQYGSAPSTPTGQEYYNKASEVLSNIPPVMPELHAAPSIAQMKAELQYGAAKAAPHAGKAVHNILEAQGLGPSYVVPPKGNLNFQPAISAEALKGPEKQRIQDFMMQAKKTPGVTQEGLNTGLPQISAFDPATTLSKSEFESHILPSEYSKIDLLKTELHPVYYIDAERDVSPHDVYRRMGVPNNLLNAVGDYIAGVPADELPNDFHTWLEVTGLNRFDLQDAIADARHELVNEVAHDYAYAENGEAGLGNYRYKNSQRLLDSNRGYFEFGVTHPSQLENTRHYSEHDNLIGHVRGSFLPKTQTRKGTPLTIDNAYINDPGAMVIEEIQADSQKGMPTPEGKSTYLPQVGHKHQVHGTLVKAAVQHALENDAKTIYFPTARPIAKVRRKPAEDYTAVYNQAIVKEGLNPLKKIPGITITKVIDPATGMHNFNKVDISTKAKEHILAGPGQKLPGYKTGGVVHMQEGGVPSSSDWTNDPTLMEQALRNSKFTLRGMGGKDFGANSESGSAQAEGALRTTVPLGDKGVTLSPYVEAHAGVNPGHTRIGIRKAGAELRFPFKDGGNVNIDEMRLALTRGR